MYCSFVWNITYICLPQHNWQFNNRLALSKCIWGKMGRQCNRLTSVIYCICDPDARGTVFVWFIKIINNTLSAEMVNKKFMKCPGGSLCFAWRRIITGHGSLVTMRCAFRRSLLNRHTTWPMIFRIAFDLWQIAVLLIEKPPLFILWLPLLDHGG